MQNVTQTLLDAIRSQYSVPIAKIELCDAAETFQEEITQDLLSFEVDVATSRKITRMFTITLDNKSGKYTPDPDLHAGNILWYNKTLKVYSGYKTGVNRATTEMLPNGVFVIESIKTNMSGLDNKIEIKASDKMTRLLEDKFQDVYKIENLNPVVSDNYASVLSGSIGSVSTFQAAGDNIQRQGRIHYVKNIAVINGIQTVVENERVDSYKNPDNMLNDTTLDKYIFAYSAKSGETVTYIESEIFVDLQDREQVQQIVINLTDGAVLTDYVYTSPDNAIWTSYTTTTITPSADVRYIKFKVRKTTGTGSLFTLGISEIVVKTSTNSVPSGAIDGDPDSGSWKPKSTDVDPWYKVDFGVIRTFNQIWLHWGDNAFDFDSRVRYFMERSNDNTTWTRITDLNGLDELKSTFGDQEHPINAVSCRYLRINIKGWNGSVKLRNISVKSVTGVEYIDTSMKNILTAAGFTSHSIPKTREFVGSYQAQIGEEKSDFLQRLAKSAGWKEPEISETGVYTTSKRNINPVDVAWTVSTETDNIFEFNPLFTNDIYNVVLVVCSPSDQKAIVSSVQDNNPLSPTYIGDSANPGLGKRVIKYEPDWADTQEKADQYALEQLFARTRVKQHQTNLPASGHPGLQIDDVIALTIQDTKTIDKKYLVTGFNLKFEADPISYDIDIHISQL